MLTVPSYKLSDTNVFNFRDHEWKEDKIVSTIQSIFSCCEDYNILVKSISIDEKQNKTNHSEIKRTISKILNIKMVYTDPLGVEYPIEMPYEIPWLINNHFYIGGNFKISIYQLYDKPVIIAGDMIKIRTNIHSFMVKHKVNERRNCNFEASMYGKKFPFAKLVIAYYGVNGCKEKFSLDDSFAVIPSDYDNKTENMLHLREDVIKILLDASIDKVRLFETEFNRMEDKQVVDNTLLVTKIDVFSAKYMTTPNIIEEFIHVIENGSYNDTDYANKRLRFIEHIIYYHICKDLYGLITSIKKNRKFRYSVNSKVILSSVNVSEIVQYDTSINPLSELAMLSRTSLSGPGGFAKSNVPVHLREIHPSMVHLVDTADTGDRDGCGTSQYVVPSAKFGEDGTLLHNGDDDPINSVSISMVPFLEHDDPVRLQMSSSQQRHSIMLKDFDLPLVQSGVEGMYSEYTSFIFVAKDAGTVLYRDDNIMVVKYQNGKFDTFHIGYRKLYISVLDFYHVYFNQGESFESGAIVAESNYMKDGRITLGRNVSTCITPWYGYNYEDSIVVSERLRDDKVFCSVHYGELVIEIPTNKILTNINPDGESYLPIPKIGTFLTKGQVVAKLKTIDMEQHPDVIFEPESEKLCDENCEIIDIKVYANKWNESFPEYASFIKSSITNQNTYKDNLIGILSSSMNDNDVTKIMSILEINQTDKNNYKLKGDSVDGVRIEITTKYERNLNIGDKLANRHGNKGVISIFVPEDKMPVGENGQRADIVINPLGIVSRMNTGQVSECHLATAVMNFRKTISDMVKAGNTREEILKHLFGFIDIIDNTKNKNYSKQTIEMFNDSSESYESFINNLDNFFVIQPPFESIEGETLKRALEYTNTPYEIKCFDPISNNWIERDLAMGYMYFMKLNHIAEDKLAYRGIGPYSAKTSQPLGGKSRKGGQRLGEMEVWSIIGHGDEENLRECVTVKSDSIQLRNKYISESLSIDQITPDTEDDEVPQSLRLLQTCLYSIGLGFNLHEGETPVNTEIDSFDEDEIIPIELESDEDETPFDNEE